MNLKYWQAVNLAMKQEMQRDRRVCVIGEDVGGPGGPFGATRGLQEHFGDLRVRDTPISEAGIVGAAVGAAMGGIRPIVEIMFIDFITLAMDQLMNQAAKMRYMAGGEYTVPLVLRTMCGAHRNAGPQHSQSPEGMLAGIPGIKVVWGSTPKDAFGLLKAAVRDEDPVVVIESSALWGRRGDIPDDEEFTIPIGSAAVRRPGTDVTVVSWGAAVERAMSAAEIAHASGLSVEVIDLRSLQPLDIETVLDSVSRTHRLAIVQDGTGPCSVGSEVAASVCELAFDQLLAPIYRLNPPFAPVPFPSSLEKGFYPQVSDIAAQIIRMAK